MYICIYIYIYMYIYIYIYICRPVGGRSVRGHVAIGGRSRGRVSCGPVGGRPAVLTGLIYMYLNIS